MENDFLLIDEPTNHLDQDAREIIKKYLASKKGFILVSHDRDLLDACIDHVLVLNRKTIEVQSRVTQYERRMEREIQEKEGLLQDIEQPVSLKLMPLSYHKERLISCRELSVRYEGAESDTLKNLTFELMHGERVFLHGENGCGKSTLLKSLNRMNDLVEGCRIDGQVLLDGEDIYGKMDVNLLRKRVGMVFQKPNPFPMSIYDNIAYGPRTHGIRSKSKLDDIVEKSLRDAAIWEETKNRLKSNALGMSGGQQQRLCIARALAVQPEVLLMDEPTSALDPISTSKIEELAMELKKEYTIVMVTHNMQQAARISDKTAFFLLGEIVEFGETEQLFSMPKDKRTEDYITGRFG